MEGDVGVVSEDAKHGEEVHIGVGREQSPGDTVNYGAGRGQVCINPD